MPLATVLDQKPPMTSPSSRNASKTSSLVTIRTCGAAHFARRGRNGWLRILTGHGRGVDRAMALNNRR